MSLPKLIGIVGKARSGKTTVAEYLRDKYGYTIASCAAPLKQLVVQALNNNTPPLHCLLGPGENTGPLCPRVDYEKLIYRERTAFTRWLLQFVGTDIGRELDPNIWVKKLNDILEGYGTNSLRTGKSIAIPDVRFRNEAELICNHGGQIWRTVRTDGAGAIEHGADHISELEADSIKADFTIRVPTGIEWIHSAVDAKCDHPSISFVDHKKNVFW